MILSFKHSLDEAVYFLEHTNLINDFSCVRRIHVTEYIPFKRYTRSHFFTASTLMLLYKNRYLRVNYCWYLKVMVVVDNERYLQ